MTQEDRDWILNVWNLYVIKNALMRPTFYQDDENNDGRLRTLYLNQYKKDIQCGCNTKTKTLKRLKKLVSDINKNLI